MFLKQILLIVAFGILCLFPAKSQSINLVIHGDANGATQTVPHSGSITKSYTANITGLNGSVEIQVYFRRSAIDISVAPIHIISIQDARSITSVVGQFVINATDFPAGVTTGLVYAKAGGIYNSNTFPVALQAAPIPPISNNSIAANQSILPNKAPSKLIGATPGGGTGAYTYQWQSSTDKITWTDIAGATNKDYQPPVLTKNTYYRRVVSSASVTSISNVVTITIGPPNDLVIDTPFPEEQRFTFEACNTITVKGNVHLQGPVIRVSATLLAAGKKIQLLPGVHIGKQERIVFPPGTTKPRGIIWLTIKEVCPISGGRTASSTEEISTLTEDTPASYCQVFPNPFTDSFDIQLQENALKSQIVVMALDGRVIYHTHTENKPVVSFDGRHLPAGLYLVRVIPANGKEEQFKLLKQ